MKAHRAALLAFWLSAAVVAGATVADNPHPGAPHEISMDQAVKLVEREYRARVVKAETQHNGAHTTYVLRLLNDSGKVWTVHVDAASGAVR
jgi:uncharacterized membrane protein YkoI